MPKPPSSHVDSIYHVGHSLDSLSSCVVHLGAFGRTISIHIYISISKNVIIYWCRVNIQRDYSSVGFQRENVTYVCVYPTPHI